MHKTTLMQHNGQHNAPPRGSNTPLKPCAPPSPPTYIITPLTQGCIKSSKSIQASDPSLPMPSRTQHSPTECQALLPEARHSHKQATTSMCPVWRMSLSYLNISNASRRKTTYASIQGLVIQVQTTSTCACSSWNNQGSSIHHAPHITWRTPKHVVNTFVVTLKANMIPLYIGDLWVILSIQLITDRISPLLAMFLKSLQGKSLPCCKKDCKIH